jgi:hypothetical protein
MRGKNCCPTFFPYSESKNSNKRGGEGKKFFPAFFVATNITKLKIIFFLIRDPGSEKNNFRIPVPGVRKASDPG